MKRWLFAAALVVAAFPALAADIGVSIRLGDPNFYGRIDIGDYPKPQLIYSQPRYVHRYGDRRLQRAPIYLRVRPSHARHWDRYCYRYDACNERVYFVHDNWYNKVYVPRYHERHRGRGNDRGHDRREDRRDDRRNDRRNDRRDDRDNRRDNGHR